MIQKVIQQATIDAMMGVQAQKSAKNTSAKFERNFTSAKVEILYNGNFLETICW